MKPNRFSKMAGIAVAVAIVLLAGCGKSKPKEETGGDEAEPPAPVTVETAVAGAIDRVVTADAVLFPVNQSSVTSKISAPVKRVLVNRGDHVRAGQLLAELENADLTAAVQESQYQYVQAQATYQNVSGASVVDDRNKAQADLETAQTAYAAAKKLYESRSALQKEGALAQRSVDEAQVAMVQAQIQVDAAQKHLNSLNQVGGRETVRAAQAQMDAAKAHVDTSSVQAGYAKITSPISGVIAEKLVYAGEMAGAGSPVVSIVDISQVVARANVPVKEAAYITVGRPARVTGPEGDIAGKVTVVSPAVDPTTTTVEVWVQIPNPGEKLKPGGTVRVAIIAETIQNTLVVPAAALLNSDDGGQKVMVIDKDKIAHERSVSLGVRQGDRVQIVSGVQAGDQVVTSGGLGLEDKAKVEVRAAKDEDDDDDSGDEGK